MKKLIVGALVLGGSVTAASAASAATFEVCPKGCSSKTIQGAINLASAGDTVSVAPGTYVENLVIPRPLTLKGTGDSSILRPAVSGPQCADGSSLCTGSSTLVLVQADDVTIKHFRLEGDNPHLKSGATVAGADVDARNGIVTDHRIGVFQRLTVSDVSVRDVYFRGLYASSGGSFTFSDNRVNNVQGEASSVAIFNFGGSGLIARNTVYHAEDAISSNWSKGTKYLDNLVRHSASGIHTDNNGGFGGQGDLIQNNQIEDCTTDGYGLFSFAPYVAATFEDNEVRGCTIGMAAFGSNAAVTTAFFDNTVRGQGATSSASQQSLGVWVSTSLFSFGFASVSATFEGNEIEGFDTGVLVNQTSGGSASATLQEDSIHGNETGADGLPGTTVDATHSYWGCKAGPNHKGCDTAIGTVDFTPWRTKL